MSRVKFIALAACAVAAAGTANATLVTLSGANVDFLIEDTQPGLALYGGMPTVAGDSLLFFPTTFRAESNNAAGAVSVDATIHFELRSRNATNIDLSNVSVSEFGDYFITPGSGGSVSAVAQLGAINLQAANPPGSFRQDVQQTGSLTATGANPWTLVTDIDFRQVWLTPTDRVALDLQNNLSATSVLNPSEAWIQKKFQGMIVDVQVVPVPPALPLLLSGVAGLAFLRRRPRVERFALG